MTLASSPSTELVSASGRGTGQENRIYIHWYGVYTHTPGVHKVSVHNVELKCMYENS